MPDLHLSEREQHLLRALIAVEPSPGAPLPSDHVLEMLSELVPCDWIAGMLVTNQGVVDAAVELPRLETDFWCVEGSPTDTYLGLLQWSRRPRAAIEAEPTLEGVADSVSIGFRSGSRWVAQINWDRRATPFSERDLAVLRLLYPALERHLRTRPTPRLPASLTVQERRVLMHVSAGLSNREIAEQMYVATSTVRKHLEHAYAKLGVTNRLAAVVTLHGQQLSPADEPDRIQFADRLS